MGRAYSRDTDNSENSDLKCTLEGLQELDITLMRTQNTNRAPRESNRTANHLIASLQYVMSRQAKCASPLIGDRQQEGPVLEINKELVVVHKAINLPVAPYRREP